MGERWWGEEGILRKYEAQQIYFFSWGQTLLTSNWQLYLLRNDPIGQKSTDSWLNEGAEGNFGQWEDYGAETRCRVLDVTPSQVASTLDFSDPTVKQGSCHFLVHSWNRPSKFCILGPYPQPGHVWEGAVVTLSLKILCILALIKEAGGWFIS